MYSMTSAYPYGQSQKTSTAWLNWYNTDNRNVMKVKDADRRFKLLKQGSVEITDFLKVMPESKHDMHSFTVDLVLFTVSTIFRGFLALKFNVHLILATNVGVNSQWDV